MSYRDEEETFITTLRQFKTALKEHTEEYLHKTFRWKRVESWIDRILEKNVEDIVMDALGYENDSFERGWKLRRHNSSENGILHVIRTLAQKQAEELLPGFIEAKRAAIDKQISSAKFKKDIVNMYSSELDSAIRNRMKTWVAQQADAVVEEVFDRHTEDYGESIKLKCPLAMDSLLLLAKGTDAPDNR